MAGLAVSSIGLPALGGVTAPAKPAGVGGGFGDALGRAVADVNALQQEANAAASAIASGERVDMTQALVAIEKANISFQFALQVRNKLLEAYQEIMRMQV